MSELAALVGLIERMHVDPRQVVDSGVYPDGTPWESYQPISDLSEAEQLELHDCAGFREGLACCLWRLRDSDEFRAAIRALGGPTRAEAPQ